jgi:hypothetical protein
MRPRKEVEAAFGKLPVAARQNILKQWGFKTFFDIPDRMMDGVGLDIVEANPSAFGTIMAHTKRRTTADAMNALADEVYGDKPGNPEVGDEDAELNQHNQPDVGGIFSGKDAVIDADAIFARYNRPKGKRGDDPARKASGGDT